MTRSLPEWIADHDDQAIPARVKVRIFERCEGRCYVSGRRMSPGDFDYDHIIALANGGQHRESNIAVIAKDKHKLKTALDVKVKSKIARVKAKHLGVFPKPQGSNRLQSRGFERGARGAWK